MSTSPGVESSAEQPADAALPSAESAASAGSAATASTARGSAASNGFAAASLNGTAPTVLAAGVLCWRTTPAGLELLMVHRPKYDDWSFPKGKLEVGESLPECAIRELAEETGVEAVLGRALPSVRYIDQNGAVKQSSYWAGRALHQGRATAPTTEVDGVAWVPLEQVGELLAHPTDAAPLDVLAAMAADGELDTTPVLIIRHGTARPRDAWARADADRPLIASGRRQAASLASLLACWQPEYLLSSSWRRCVDTVTPYAALAKVKIRTKGGLTERAFRRDPNKARRHLFDLIERERRSAMCTHRPVLAGVFRALRERTTRELIKHVPQDDPYLAPGEVLVAHVIHPSGRRATIVGIERYVALR
ncbi:MAG: NUDIX hydrolase [Kineosporiaceae bacterium]|nr:NUDIX hydrolase [Kineosporiaceae bacterium]